MLIPYALAWQEIGKSYASKASNAANKASASAVAEEGTVSIERVFANGAK